MNMLVISIIIFYILKKYLDMYMYIKYVNVYKNTQKYLKYLKKYILALNARHNLLSNFFSKKKLKRCLK